MPPNTAYLYVPTGQPTGQPKSLNNVPKRLQQNDLDPTDDPCNLCAEEAVPTVWNTSVIGKCAAACTAAAIDTTDWAIWRMTTFSPVSTAKMTGIALKKWIKDAVAILVLSWSLAAYFCYLPSSMSCSEVHQTVLSIENWNRISLIPTD